MIAPDLVVFGNLLVDDVVFPDGSTRMAQPGGAVLHFALGSALWGVRPGIVSVRGTDYPEWALEAFAARGIDTSGVQALGRPGGRVWLLYEDARRQIVHRLDRPTHAEVSPGPQHVPAAWSSAKAFHLAPMPFEAQRDLVRALADRPAFLSLDPWLPLRPDTLAQWREVVASVDAFFLSEDEMEIDRDDPLPVVRSLAGGRLRYVVYKQGVRGGLLYDARDDRAIEWTARADTIVDPTGAGDAFAAGILAGWLRAESHEAALQRGVVGASFALSAWGADGLLATTPQAAAARRQEWFGA